MAAETVEFDVVATVTKALKSLQTLETQATQSVESISSAFSGLKTVAVAALGFFAAGEVVQFLNESIKAANESDLAFSQLTSSLKSIGEFTPEAIKAFEDFATQIQKTSKFSDEAVFSQLSLAKQLGLTDQKAKELVQASVDLAAVTGDSLEGAFSELSKTLTGSAGKLSKTIPQVKAFTEEQLKSGEAIKLVSDRLKGASIQALDNFAGASIQASNSIGDIKENIGKVITQNPVLISAIKEATKLFDSLAQSVANNQETFTSLLSVTIKLVSKGITLLIDGITFVAEAFQGSTLAVQSAIIGYNELLKTILSFSAVQSVISTITESFSSFFSLVIDQISVFINALSDIPFAGKAFEKLGINIEDVQKTLKDTSKTLKDFKLDESSFKNIEKNIQSVNDSVLEFGDSFNTSIDSSINSAKSFSDTIKLATQNVINSDSEAVISSKAVASQKELESQAAIKAANEAANARAKQLAIEKEFGDKVKAFAEQLSTAQISESDKVEYELQKNLTKISEFYEKGAISVKEVAELNQKAFENADKKRQEILDKALQEDRKQADEREKFIDNLLDKQTASLKAIEIARDADLAKINQYQRDQLIGVKEAEDLRASIIENSEQKTFEVRVAANKKYSDAISSFVNNGLQGLAKSAVSAAVDVIAPGFGEAAGQIFGFLSQSTDKFKETLNALFSTDFINAIVANLNTLVEQLPGIVSKLITFIAENAGTIIGALINAVIAATPEIISALIKIVTELALNPKFYESLAIGIGNGVSAGLKNLAADAGAAIKKGITDIKGELKNAFKDSILGGFNDALVGIKEAINKLASDIKSLFKIDIPGLPGSGGGGGGVLGKVGKALGFAEGGVVPDGFPNDTFPARLTSGEMILPPQIAKSLLDLSQKPEQSNSENEGLMIALLTKINDSLSNPQMVNTTIQLGTKELANVMLNLSRNNARLAV